MVAILCWLECAKLAASSQHLLTQHTGCHAWMAEQMIHLWHYKQTLAQSQEGKSFMDKYWKIQILILTNKTDLTAPHHDDVEIWKCVPCHWPFGRGITLQWRHNGPDGISNRQPYDCLLNRLLRHRSKKTSKLRITGLCAGNSPGSVNSPHKGPVTRKMFPFDGVIMNQSSVDSPHQGTVMGTPSNLNPNTRWVVIWHSNTLCYKGFHCNSPAFVIVMLYQWIFSAQLQYLHC